MSSVAAFHGTPLLRVCAGARPVRVPVCRRPRSCAAADASSDTAQSEPETVVAPSTPAPPPPRANLNIDNDSPASYVNVPGKIQFNPDELAAQKASLDKLAATFRKERLQREYDATRKFGFVKNAERFNGRTAMFFFVVGLLTEYWTGYTMPQQIELMLNTVGVYF
jgi:hypothetical protein